MPVAVSICAEGSTAKSTGVWFLFGMNADVSFQDSYLIERLLAYLAGERALSVMNAGMAFEVSFLSE